MFTMKPERSLVTIARLPIRSANSLAASRVSSEVSRAMTTSIRRITGTGLKKWRPRTRSGRGSPAASWAIGIEEVLEEIRASSETMPATWPRMAAFRSAFSGTASITRSTPSMTPSSVV